MDDYTIGKIVYEVCDALWKRLRHRHMPMPSTELNLRVADGFWRKTQFPHCIGAIDGMQCEIKSPANSGAMYFNYKGYYSIGLQAVSDASGRFVSIDVGSYGKQADGGTFAASSLRQRIEEDRYGVPPDAVLPGSDTVASFVLVGDDAYPCTPYLMKPHPGVVPANQHYANSRLSRARCKVECAFGNLKRTFGCMDQRLDVGIEHAMSIIKTCCLLRNVIIDLEGEDDQRAHQRPVEVDAIQPANRQGPRYPDISLAAGEQIRDLFTEYLNSHVGRAPDMDHRYL